MELSNNIKLMCRIRPNFKNNENCVTNKNNEIFVEKKQPGIIKTHQSQLKYSFNKVFGQDDVNIDVYDYIGIEMIKYVIKHKKNVTFYVYGQTGSGKTHTLLGGNKEKGMLQEILDDMMEIGYDTKICALEIYNNKCYDLLQNKKKVHQRDNGARDFVFPGVVLKPLKNAKDIADFNDIISNNRKVGVSSENDTSSRSHLLIEIRINGQFLRILDLAGCEKANQAICKSRQEYYENGEINQNLFALKECIRCLLKKQSHIPYRRCELTKMLKQSFEPGNQTYILATISPYMSACHTSIDVLNYINSIKNIKTQLPQKSSFQQFLGSPRFNNFMEKKNVLTQLSIKEKNLLESMVQEKTTRVHMDLYLDVLDQKKKLLAK